MGYSIDSSFDVTIRILVAEAHALWGELRQSATHEHSLFAHENFATSCICLMLRGRIVTARVPLRALA